MLKLTVGMGSVARCTEKSVLLQTVGMGSVARCTDKSVLLQNWSNEINIAQLLLKYGTMKL